MPLLLQLTPPLLLLQHLQVPWAVITVMATMVVSRTKVTSLERQDQVFIIQQMQCLLLPSLCCLLEEDSGSILLTSSSSLVSTKVRVLFVVCILLVFVLYAQLGLFFTFFSLVCVIWVSLFLFQAKIFWLVDVIDYTA
jgi:hypothetical protein